MFEDVQDPTGIIDESLIYSVREETRNCWLDQPLRNVQNQ
jgi:hypothetical protein